ncbi:probable protein phosphatase 2C 23 [Juglans microcarpa x Juglans regia]|uniref:probable protein phosphatase 2C 23 n=1 Tax=Juglans microcarpa x Juglans regia TaxID=2249226 RepID=UPI001B7F028C|nr:probable protein phosphatase 2C 23 [Juglans microcarpa x Juglans regia]
MGNNIGKACHCLDAAGEISRRQHDFPVILSDQLDEGLGHSFRYFPPGLPWLFSSSSTSEVDGSFATTTFRSISGASVSANTSTPLSTSLPDLCSFSVIDRASSFASSTSFFSSPLQPLPRCSIAGSAPSTTKKFVSGPIEEVCGKLQNGGPIYKARTESEKPRFINIFRKLIFHMKSIAAALIKADNNVKKPNSKKKNWKVTVRRGDNLYSKRGDAYDQESQYSMEKEKLQWAEGKAGEDRVQVVISEEHGWVFVGIYDGFNGPDATEYLLSILYSNVHNELKDLVWNAKFEPTSILSNSIEEDDQTQTRNIDEENDMLRNADMDLDPYSNRNVQVKNSKDMREGLGMKWKGKSQSSWSSCECDVERSVEPERKLLTRQLSHLEADRPMGSDIHSEVLRALSEALRKTEDAYLEIADDNVEKSPELALMGSCVLVMLMKNEDVYLMNVGDSRAVLAQEAELDDLGPRKMHLDFKQIREDTSRNHNLVDHGFGWGVLPNLIPLQLTTDHSTYVEEEVQRIRTDHPDDASAIENDRVKGYLKVTRAFGVGFLKQPKWNDALLEKFRIEYVGTSPYITCLPSLYHYRLGPRDRFLILSSDGLYQYLSNEEAVSQVEYFIDKYPKGDPAQHLIEQVLFQAAQKHGMELDELLDIPQGERRRYHDDVSIVVIYLEGRIWRSYI